MINFFKKKKKKFKIFMPVSPKQEEKEIDKSILISKLLNANDKKYEIYWKRHYDILNEIRFNLYSKSINEKNIFNKYSVKCLQLCYEDLNLAPHVIEWEKEKCKILNQKYIPLNYGSHKYLIMILEKQGKYDEAIDICNRYISLGLIDDGTKGGITKRREKLIIKKVC